MGHVSSVKPLEKSIEKKVVEWARNNGWLAWKLWGFSQIGLPDRMFLHSFPVVVFIEFKRPGEVPRAIQERTRKELAIRGWPCYYADNYGTAISILQRELATARVPEARD